MAQVPWSKYQLAVFDAVMDDEDDRHVLVTARAGCAKTTTITEASKRLDDEIQALMCAFNKEIANELERKVLGNTRVSTLHSLGLKTLQKTWSHVGRLEPTIQREREIIKKVMPRLAYENSEKRGDVSQLVRMAKAYVYESDKDLEWLMNEYDCAPTIDADENVPLYCKWARDALELSRTPNPQITFDDMVYVPAYLGLTTGRYGRVFVDETQDLNRAQLMLAEHAVSGRGKIVFVGDDRQAIYGFRGADSNSIPNIRARFNPRELFLTVTYRCPRKIVELVQRYVPDFQAAPSAPEGVVEKVNDEYMKANWKPGDFVIARLNAVLVSLCMEALANGIPAFMAGRDIGAGLIKLIERSGCTDIPSLLTWVRQWQSEETRRMVLAEEDESKITAVTDKANTVIALTEGRSSIHDLIQFVRGLFGEADKNGGEGRPRLAFMTAHKAKGLENPRVWMIDSTFRPSKGIEEENLFYVAATRAQQELYRVYIPKRNKPNAPPLIETPFDHGEEGVT